MDRWNASTKSSLDSFDHTAIEISLTGAASYSGLNMHKILSTSRPLGSHPSSAPWVFNLLYFPGQENLQNSLPSIHGYNVVRHELSRCGSLRSPPEGTFTWVLTPSRTSFPIYPVPETDYQYRCLSFDSCLFKLFSHWTPCEVLFCYATISERFFRVWFPVYDLDCLLDSESPPPAYNAACLHLQTTQEICSEWISTQIIPP